MPIIASNTTPLNYIDYAESLGLSNPNRTPLLGQIVGMGGYETITQTGYNWVDYQVESTSTTLTAPVIAGNTSFTVADSSIFEVGSYAVLNNELVRVTALTNATTIAVTRAQGGTTAGTGASGDYVFIAADGRAEGALFASEQFKGGANYINYTQIITTSVEMTGTALAQDAVGTNGLSKWDLEVAKKQAKHEAKIEKAMMQGTPFQVGTARAMGGVRHFLNSGNVVSVGDFSTNFFNKLSELCRQIYLKGGDIGDGNYLLITSPIVMQNVSLKLKDYVTNNTTDLKMYGQAATSIMNDYGQIPLLMSPNLQAGEAYLIDITKIKAIGMAGNSVNRTMQYIEMGIVGDKRQAQFLSELTMEIRDIHLQGKLVGITF